MGSHLVAVDSRARHAWPWLPALTRAGRVYVGPCGETLIARADGGLDVVHRGAAPWNRSAASDPCPSRAA
jgi:hypothetical protein